MKEYLAECLLNALKLLEMLNLIRSVSRVYIGI